MSILTKLRSAELVAEIKKAMPNKRQFMKDNDLSANQYKTLLKNARTVEKAFDREALKRDIEAMTITQESIKDIAKRHNVSYGVAYYFYNPTNDPPAGQWPVPHYLEPSLPSLPDKPGIFDYRTFSKMANYL